MNDQKIIVEIRENGEIKAETFGYQSTDCMDELTKLMKNLLELTEETKKPDYYKAKNLNVKKTVIKR